MAFDFFSSFFKIFLMAISIKINKIPHLSKFVHKIYYCNCFFPHFPGIKFRWTISARIMLTFSPRSDYNLQETFSVDNF